MAINRTDLQSLIDSNLPDNHNNLITPILLREVVSALNDSDLNLITDTSLLGLSDWSNSIQYSSSGTVVYQNVIYRAIQNTTVGTFIPSEYSILSTYIDSTSGLSIFLEKDNGIELDDNKLVKTIATDSTLSTAVTGIYKVQAVSAPIAPNQEYPVLGKAIMVMYRRFSNTESMMFYYPTTDLTHYYVRTLSTTWFEFKSAVNYTFTNGIQNIANVISIGGTFTDIQLEGSSLILNTDTFISGTTGLSGLLNQTGDFSLGTNDSNIVSSSSDLNIKSGDITLDGNVQVNYKATYQTNPYSVDLPDSNDIPSWQVVRDYTTAISSFGTELNNGITSGTNGTGGLVAGLGGSLITDTTINGNLHSLTLASLINYKINGNSSTSSFVNTYFNSTVSTVINAESDINLTVTSGPVVRINPLGISLEHSSGQVVIGQNVFGASSTLNRFDAKAELTYLTAQYEGILYSSDGVDQFKSVDWINRKLWNSAGTIYKMDWENSKLYYNNGSNGAAINWALGAIDLKARGGDMSLIAYNSDNIRQGYIRNQATDFGVSAIDIGCYNGTDGARMTLAYDNTITFYPSDLFGPNSIRMFSDHRALIITSTSGFFVPSRMTTTQKNAVTAVLEGSITYDTTLNKLCVYTGSVWETITSL